MVSAGRNAVLPCLTGSAARRRESTAHPSPRFSSAEVVWQMRLRLPWTVKVEPFARQALVSRMIGGRLRCLQVGMRRPVSENSTRDSPSDARVINGGLRPALFASVHAPRPARLSHPVHEWEGHGRQVAM